VARPDDPEAYRLLLQGRHLIDRRGREDVERGINYLRQSLERDPGYALAWAELARGYTSQGDSGHAPSAEAYGRAREAVGRALALDPNLAIAHGRLSWIQASYDWDWEAARASAQRALELEPGNADALRAAANIAGTLGQFEEAIDLTRKAIERDPLRPSLYGSLGYLLLAAHREGEAEEAFRKALELGPEGGGRHTNLGLSLLHQRRAEEALSEMQLETEEVWRVYGLAHVYAALRRTSDADAALAELERKFGGEMAFQIAEVHAYRGETDLAFEWLDRAYAQRDTGVSDIKNSRFLQPPATDPRYKAFLKKVKLPG
jgi:tetratricopeptide (TPR) repeat protein